MPLRTLLAALAGLSSMMLDQPHGPSLVEVLAAAGRYVAEYERSLTSVVAEEEYTQRLGQARGAPSRRLRSDLLLIFEENVGHIGFRDVFEVDGRPVRDRERRLENLFLKATPNPLARARRIVRESARYNLNYDSVHVERTINMPLVALKFLRAGNQTRSSFSIDTPREGTTGDVVLRFREQARPRLIESPDEQAAQGAFWVDPVSGRIAQSELRARTAGTHFTIRVSYAHDPALDLWLPASMYEEYRIAMTGLVVGEARYSNFRRFQVQTETAIDVPR